jgi:hypothetical protein
MIKRNNIIVVMMSVMFLFAAQELVGKEKDNNRTLRVSLGEEFVLHSGQSAKIKKTGLGIKITRFIYSPCPKNARCIWSGLGVVLEYQYKGEAKKGINLARAFGYQTTIMKTDYKTFARLKIEKIR